MSTSDLEKARQEQELTIQRQIAFASRFFQGDVTVHTLLESFAEGVVIIDNSGIILLVNTSAEQMFGYPKKELIGTPFSCFYPEEERKAGKPEEELKQTAVKGRVSYEDWRIRKDGSRFWADVIITALYDEKGKLRGFSSVTHDITEYKKVEEALRISGARYRAMFSNNPAMITTLAADLTMLSVNPLFASLLGYTIKELEGQSILKMICEDDRPAVVEQLRRCLQNPDEVNRWRFRNIRKDGSLLWVEEIAQAVHDENGELNVMVVCQNVTERKQMEEALRESETKFSAAFHATPNVFVISSLADGRYLEVNEAFERVIGYRRDEVIGRSSLELNIWQNPEERAMVLRMLAEGKKVRDLEINLRSKSGAMIVGLYAAEIIDIGAEKCLVSLVSDITARKKVEEALRKSEAKFSQIFHSVPVLITISTLAEGRFIDVNETCLRTLGYQRQELLGRTSLELGIWGSKEDRERVIRELEEHGTVRDLEVNLRNKSGETVPALFSAELIDFSGNQYMLSLVSDISKRKQAEDEIVRLNTDLAARAAELEAANRELETFNYAVAHDLRKPLTVVNGYCQIIEMVCGECLNEECKGYLREAYDGTVRMNRLIDALLKFSIMAHIELNRETVDLSSMAQAVAVELAQAEPARRVEFRISDGIAVNADVNLLRVVLNNLLGNAWKYTGMREEGIIEFGTTDVAGRPAYFVRDNGAGFDMAAADKLFAPFQRLPGAEAEGHGIGLSTVERIISRHGGKVWAEGEPGKGSTFYFTLAAD